jgi:predicted GNAT superfamily acetyltransferase
VTPMTLRQLTGLDDYRRVLALEQRIWGYTSADDAVPVPIMIVTQKTGGLLLGAYDDDDRLVGFAYSLPGIRDGRPFQWSHMLGVVDTHRDRGIGRLLKLEQRRLVLAAGLDLIEWTFDPLQALNAHLNLVTLGAIIREYHLDVYGESSSVLHRGTPTDRFVAEWWLRSERVEERVAGIAPAALLPAAAVNEVGLRGDRLAPGPADLSLGADRLAVVIPTGFTELQQADAGLARAWRASTREIFTTYLPRGYEVIDFVLDRAVGRGTYIMERRTPAAG